MKDRFYSFLITWFSAASSALATAVAPLLALRLGADAMALGVMGLVAHTVRLPLCLASGHVSERIGRTRIIVPVMCLVAVGMVGMALSREMVTLVVFYCVAVAFASSFYPPFQALIGDISKRGHLRKNLAAFNLGWCMGATAAALGAGWIVIIGLHLAPYFGAVTALVAAGLLLAWRNKPASHEEESTGPFPDYPGYLLLIARMGHFTSFFGQATIRIIFPKLGQTLGWSDPSIARVVAMVMVGQAVGMIAASASPWWRGKLWPQVGAQGLLLVAACGIAAASSPVLLGACFLAAGIALSVIYAGALYYGLCSRKERGRNAGTHEFLVAAAYVAGSLLSGLLAQYVSPRAPYVLLACLAAVCMVTAFFLTRTRPPKRAEPT